MPMEKTKRRQKEPQMSENERSERLTQVRHLQTLRWAYLSTYLAGLGWFLSMYFDNNSSLSGNDIAVLLSTVGLGVLGVFIGFRIRQYTRIIRHDLERIGTSIRGLGWLEYVFVFIVTAIILTFGILSYSGIL
jgi:hypothetical protein